MKVINLQMERLKREQRKIRNIEKMTFSDYIDYLLRTRAQQSGSAK
jgi:hypothetical protein